MQPIHNVLSLFTELIRSPLHICPSHEGRTVGGLDDCFYGNPLPGLSEVERLIVPKLVSSGARQLDLWQLLAGYGIEFDRTVDASGTVGSASHPRLMPYPTWVDMHLRRDPRFRGSPGRNLHDEKENRTRLLLLFEVLRALADVDDPQSRARLSAVGWSCHADAFADDATGDLGVLAKLWTARWTLEPHPCLVANVWAALELLATALLAMEGKRWSDVPKTSMPEFVVSRRKPSELVAHTPVDNLADATNGAMGVPTWLLQWKSFVHGKSIISNGKKGKRVGVRLQFPGQRDHAPPESLQFWLNSILSLSSATAEKWALADWLANTTRRNEQGRARGVKGRGGISVNLRDVSWKIHPAQRKARLDAGDDPERRWMSPLLLFYRASAALHYLDTGLDRSTLTRIMVARRHAGAPTWSGVKAPAQVAFIERLKATSLTRHAVQLNGWAAQLQTQTQELPGAPVPDSTPASEDASSSRPVTSESRFPGEAELILRRRQNDDAMRRQDGRFATQQTQALRRVLANQIGAHVDTSAGSICLFMKMSDAQQPDSAMRQILENGDFVCLLRVGAPGQDSSPEDYVTCEPRRPTLRRIGATDCLAIPLRCWHSETSSLPKVLAGQLGQIDREVFAYDASEIADPAMELVVFVDLFVDSLLLQGELGAGKTA
ncbi:hypothetical protein [Inhella sp.]|uniref:hypothetical protein n=1 Tax=Inhella sp. TaxID=1921806 RepID=UPI0035B1C59A